MDNENKKDDSPLSKLRSLNPTMYPVKDLEGNITGYDYGIDVNSLKTVFPWMVQTDNLGRTFLNKDSLICFLIACLLEQDRDVEILYSRINNGNRLEGWNPDKD